MDITHLLAPARTGGLERVVEMLAIGQAKRGHNVSAIAIVQLDAAEPPLLPRLRAGGVRVTVVGATGRGYRAERARVKDALSRHTPGVAHSHGYRADVLHSGIARRLGFSTVTTLHGFTAVDRKMRFYERVQRFACRRIDRVVAVSRPIADQMRSSGVSAERLRVLPNAYVSSDAVIERAGSRARLGLTDSEPFVVGCVGRLSQEKGVDVLLDAMAKLADLPITLVCIGDGDETDRLRAQGERLGIAKKIRWAGPVDGVGTLFRAFDVLALPSRTEGTPIVLFEAMSAEVPIVAAAVGGIPDVLTADEAILVSKESPSELAAGIRDVYANRDIARRRATLAAAVVRTKFAPAPWLDRYEQIYAEAGARR